MFIFNSILSRINKIPPIIFFSTMAIAGVIMLYLAATDSVTFDEKAHIGAGYAYVAKHDYRLNPEHPPLVKILAGLPLTVLNTNFPTNDPAWQAVNGQWDIGYSLLFKAGNNVDRIAFFARLGPILFALLLIVITYWWSRELFGVAWAILPTVLIGLSPTVLAHGHYVTTDVPAAFGMLTALAFSIA